MLQTTPTVVPQNLRDKFALAYKNNRVILIYAPCGSGKTVVAQELLRPYHAFYLSAAKEDFSLCAVPENCQSLLIDDLHKIGNREEQDAICEMIRTKRQRHFVFLSRGAIPGWLMPFQFSGILEAFDMADLMLDKSCVKALAKAYAVSLTNAEIGAILADTKGYPVALAILMRLLSEEAGGYSMAVLNAARQQLFLYFNEMIYLRLDAPFRQLLIEIAPFESFNVEMARLLSGNSRAGEMVARLQQNTSMLEAGPPEMLTLRPVFRAFLLWKLTQELNAEEQKNLFARAGLYYELHDEMKPALDCYARINDQRKISELLIKNAELHVGIGQYLEMERYYFAMPEKEILRSPTLMAGMSMLCSLFMDFDRSEDWYHALQDFAGRLKKPILYIRMRRGGWLIWILHCRSAEAKA